ncbi:putative FAD binding monooxygenase [Aspergillus affinis]|uniref:putative FAD binding monooxygenase n=1 Tax=Aspergillus affinis TaxID=1070780 RepID=UPI0022FEFEC8|nr:putative FAD binding monooxygenase [Aspergillus affinis]KAI9036897.1 putative FAD binding monooxygenase [Aspergillus affinis]
MPTPPTDVLIIGAGPTGLVLALWLTRQNIRVQIIDKAHSTPSTSRALAIHARTLELYRQLDLSDELLSLGHKVEATNIWSEGSYRARVPIGEVGKGLTPYPFVFILSQDVHERVLERRLNEMGVYVDRNRELVGIDDHETYVSARLKSTEDGEIGTREATYLVGCDGAHSAVRHLSGIEFEGDTYTQLFFVADIEASGPTMNGEAHVSFNQSDFCLLFAFDAGKNARISGAIDESHITKDPAGITFDDLAPSMRKNMQLDVSKVNWFTTYRVHHRLAKTFRKDRVFLVGDAGHIHSPVGGQGMNTGIGDAINLAWKLAAVVQGKADPVLLETYEVERRAFATTLVQTTDWAFNSIVGNGYLVSFFRTWIIPYAAPFMTRFERFRHRVFRGMSQTLINYRNSSLSTGNVGEIQGGDRLPWAPVGDVDNFDSLDAISWQVHVYGQADEKLVDWCRRNEVHLTDFLWNEKYQSVGLQKDAAYLLRPDTYVAVVEPSGLPDRFDEYLGTNKFRVH